MEGLKEKLYRCINKYGLQDKRTIKVSEQLDKLIVKEMEN